MPSRRAGLECRGYGGNWCPWAALPTLSLRDKGGAPGGLSLLRFSPGSPEPLLSPCYHATVFNFGKPKTVGDWMVHVAGAVVALLLVWWMLRAYVL